ncbi:MAG: tetratricopeptide repeat protein [Chitinophagaceae bacterium]
MKQVLFVVSALMTAVVIYAYTSKKMMPQDDIVGSKSSSIVKCNPGWEQIEAALKDVEIPPMPGAGNYKWKIETSSDSAQFYFNQGLNMYYGFHSLEARASFNKAAKFDMENPMIWWAVALSYGPNINDMGYVIPPMAIEATKKATAYIDKATLLGKLLIEAMQVRYTNDSVYNMKELNKAYSNLMQKIYNQFPGNADVASLYAEGLMLEHPWDFWKQNGTPKPWTPQIRMVLETLLHTSSNHPGANHYYIHVMEASPFAAKALPSADRLGKLTPGLSHMVHMPSHIYLRTGHYDKGSAINEASVVKFNEYKKLFPAVNENPFLYQYHNQHMQINCALMAGQYVSTLQTSNELKNALDTSMLSMPAPFGNYVQYFYHTPTLTYVHFSKWPQILQLPRPAHHHSYANILYHFARGMAFANTGKTKEAWHEKKNMELFMKDSSLLVPIENFSPIVEAAQCAVKLLTGTIYLKQNNTTNAIAQLKQAVDIDERMIYNEPRDWMLNPKQYLGAAYLHTRQWQKAEEAFKKDLMQNNNNIWSLYGLHQALVRQNKKHTANNIEKRLNVAMNKSDIKFTRLFF